MNLHAVKLRAEEIRKTLDHLLHTLKYAPATLQWYVITLHSFLPSIQFLTQFSHSFSPLSTPYTRSDALDKFSVLNVQLQNLSTQLRPLLQHYAVHPRSVNQSNAPILPIMLATKLLPEQEEEQDAMLASHVHKNTTTATDSDVKAIAQQTAELSALVDSLIKNGGPLDPKGPSRVKLTNSIKAATAAAAAVTQKTVEERQIGGQPWQYQQQQQQQQLRGPELLIAAACYGASLS